MKQVMFVGRFLTFSPYLLCIFLASPLAADSRAVEACVVEFRANIQAFRGELGDAQAAKRMCIGEVIRGFQATDRSAQARLDRFDGHFACVETYLEAMAAAHEVALELRNEKDTCIAAATERSDEAATASDANLESLIEKVEDSSAGVEQVESQKVIPEREAVAETTVEPDVVQIGEGNDNSPNSQGEGTWTSPNSYPEGTSQGNGSSGEGNWTPPAPPQSEDSGQGSQAGGEGSWTPPGPPQSEGSGQGSQAGGEGSWTPPAAPQNEGSWTGNQSSGEGVRTPPSPPQPEGTSTNNISGGEGNWAVPAQQQAEGTFAIDHTNVSQEGSTTTSQNGVSKLDTFYSYWMRFFPR